MRSTSKPAGKLAAVIVSAALTLATVAAGAQTAEAELVATTSGGGVALAGLSLAALAWKRKQKRWL